MGLAQPGARAVNSWTRRLSRRAQGVRSGAVRRRRTDGAWRRVSPCAATLPGEGGHVGGDRRDLAHHDDGRAAAESVDAGGSPSDGEWSALEVVEGVRRRSWTTTLVPGPGPVPWPPGGRISCGPGSDDGPVVRSRGSATAGVRGRDRGGSEHVVELWAGSAGRPGRPVRARRHPRKNDAAGGPHSSCRRPGGRACSSRGQAPGETAGTGPAERWVMWDMWVPGG